MSTERFLVTGALGCLGAWVVKRLMDEGTHVTTYDLPGDAHRLRLIMDDAAMDRVNFIYGDITDFDAFDQAVGANKITHIVHLAALQVPFVRANPVLGTRVNMVGQAVVLESSKRHLDHVRGLSYASSAAVYGAMDLYGQAPLAHDARHAPGNLYGVYKDANEGQARIYWEENKLPSIGLRPYVVYGPGRDQGMTSTPTKAMLAVALGKPYEISYGGTVVFHHADDVAGIFIKAARMSVTGAPVYNLGGNMAHMQEVIAAIELAEPAMAGQVTYKPVSVNLPEAIDDTALNQALGAVTYRSLTDGVADTITRFRHAIASGRIDAARALS